MLTKYVHELEENGQIIDMKNTKFFDHTITSETMEKIHYLVEHNNWNIKPACSMYGISKSTYMRWRAKKLRI